MSWKCKYAQADDFQKGVAITFLHMYIISTTLNNYRLLVMVLGNLGVALKKFKSP